MAIGPYVFGPGRVGLWVAPNANLTDKLKHILPRLRHPKVIPNLTDIYLPPEAQRSHADQVRAAGFFVATYGVTHNENAVALAERMLAHSASLRIDGKPGPLEIDLEGAAVQPDKPRLAAWALDFVTRVRMTNRNLPVRLNVTPFKGYALPVDMINRDPKLNLIVQCYFGNMDGRLSEADVLNDLLDWGVDRKKIQVMYGVLAENPQGQRVYSMPNPEYKPITSGSVYIDDLLLDAGILPS